MCSFEARSQADPPTLTQDSLPTSPCPPTSTPPSSRAFSPLVGVIFAFAEVVLTSPLFKRPQLPSAAFHRSSRSRERLFRLFPRRQLGLRSSTGFLSSLGTEADYSARLLASHGHSRTLGSRRHAHTLYQGANLRDSSSSSSPHRPTRLALAASRHLGDGPSALPYVQKIVEQLFYHSRDDPLSNPFQRSLGAILGEQGRCPRPPLLRLHRLRTKPTHSSRGAHVTLLDSSRLERQSRLPFQRGRLSSLLRLQREQDWHVRLPELGCWACGEAGKDGLLD